MKTIRLTAAQATVRFLSRQMTEIHGKKVQLFGGVFAIFGHGNVAGLGEALYAARDILPTFRSHNEQAMALSAVAYAKASQRRRMMACTSSIGPGATNMVACPCCSCPATYSPIANPILFCSRSRILATARSAPMIASSRSRDISIASRGPSRSCRR
jgi:TPP-dependent trihydroxycyclohexane-1,2-dione (THcHDO) dehydratase